MRLNLLLFFFTCMQSIFAQDFIEKKGIKAGLTFSTASTTTDAAATSTKAAKTTTETYYSGKLQGDYFFTNNFAVIGSFYQGNESTGKKTESGGTLGIKWHFLGLGTVLTQKLKDITVYHLPSFSPYVDFAFDRKSYKGESLLANFSGFVTNIGIDWHYWQKSFMRFSLGYEMLSSGTKADLSGIVVNFGVGSSF